MTNTIDMSGFENQFPSSLHPFMDDVMFETVSDLSQRISDLEGILSWKKDFIKFADENLDDLDRSLASLMEVVNEIKLRKAPFLEEKSAIRRDMKSDERSLESAKRELFRIMAELEAQRKLTEERDAMENATLEAPWRTGVNGKKALPHQFEGAYRLSSAKRAILGDQMGLGKTLQAIMTIDMLRSSGEAKKILIICPKPVLNGFQQEFQRWSPHQFVWVLNQTAKGLKSEILDAVMLMEECVILTNYEVWRKDRVILDKLIACQFDTVILDEAHNLQDSNSTTAKTVAQIVHAENKCEHCGSLTFGAVCPKCGQYPSEFHANRSVKNVYPMTGTPILNKPQDLFSMLNLIDSRAFPNKTMFLEDFCTRKCANCGRKVCECFERAKYVWTFTSGGEAQLLKRLGMRFTARTRESAGVEMPPQEVKHYYFDFDEEKYPKQYEFCEKLRKEALLKFSDEKELTATETFAWYTRMRQAATWPDGICVKTYQRDEFGSFVYTEDGKPIVTGEYRPSIGESIIMDEGENIISEAVESGNRVVVFSHFKEALKEMERRLHVKGIPVVRYDGDLPEKARIEAQHDFDLTVTKPKDAKFKVFLAQYKTAKVGLNLHGANEVLFLDREWNPGMENQAMNRVRRIGSKMDTIVHVLHVPGTATDLVDAIIAQKEAMLEGFESEINISEINIREAMRKFLKGE